MSYLKNMPKVELHLHLDGSLDIDDIKKEYGFTDKIINEKMIASKKCKDLNNYLTKFEFPISIMQTKNELERATINLLNKLKLQNIIYAEIRFAPQFHIKKGLMQEEVVEIVVNASKKIDIQSNFILCFMRGKDNMKENYETLEIAKKYLKNGVCGVDLAGAEAIYKTNDYEELFKKVNEYKLPFTIHAGEADGPESVKKAIEFGAKRIGHGVRCIEDEELLQELVDKNITLEICPTSNIQTCICEGFADHPISKIYKKGIRVTINTDNMTVSNTSLENEYKNLINQTDLTKEDIIKMNMNSINSAFISNGEKEKLIKILKGEV